MDFTKFRQSGELSDVEVTFGEEKWRLHRFPLYTRSDYFLKELSKGQQTIHLTNFPGSSEIFALIADFCYNINVEINPNNVLELRKVAHFLEMNGTQNLYEKTGMFIQDSLDAARRGRDVTKMLEILCSFPAYSEMEDANTLLEQSVTALSQYWNQSHYGLSNMTEKSTADMYEVLFKMDFALLVKLLHACAEKLSTTQILNCVISDYIGHILTTESEQSIDNDDESEPIIVKFDDSSLRKVKQLLDDVHPTVSLTRKVAGKWLKPLLTAYSQVEGGNEALGSIAASMANQLDAESLSAMTEGTLIHFAEKVDSVTLSDSTISIIVDHLHRQAQEAEITAQGFLRLSKVLPLVNVPCHDKLLYIIQLLSTGDVKPSADELTKLMEGVVLKKCTVKAMRDVASLGGVPCHQIAIAALDMCDLMQERLEATSRIIQEQEKEIASMSMQSFGLRSYDTPQSSRIHSAQSTPRKNKSPSSIYSNSSAPVPRIEITTPISPERHGTTPATANLGKVVDSIWRDRPQTPPNLHDSQTKLSELLRKQRYSSKK